jgi:ribonuclease VapC
MAGIGAGAMTAVNYWETLARVQIAHGEAGRERVDALLATFDIRIVSVDAPLAQEAAAAFQRYRGRPARLNLGDAFAYALATREGDGLLYKGQDFAATDVNSALDDTL